MRITLDRKTGRPAAWAAIQTAAYLMVVPSEELRFVEDIHVYTWRGVILPSVTGILKDVGIIDTAWYNEAARLRGSYVHLACALEDRGNLDWSTLDPVLVPYVEAWVRFKRESGFVPEIIETPMLNESYLYAGTPDVIGEMPGVAAVRGAVELRKNGTYRLTTYNDTSDTETWLAALAVYNYKNSRK